MTDSELTAIIVKAKAATYVGGGTKTVPSRAGAQDLCWQEGDWRYLDSYFGGTDFLGQEVLWRAGAGLGHELLWLYAAAGPD